MPIRSRTIPSRSALTTRSSCPATAPLDGTRDFAFDNEIFFLYDKDMDPAIIDLIDEALAAIYEKGGIQERQKASFLIPNFLPAEEAREHLMNKRDTVGKIIEQMSSGS